MKHRFIILPIVIALTFIGCATTATNNVLSGGDLYQAAVIDAMVAEPDEIFPLVTLSQEDPLTTWRDGKVLFLTYHRYPESYIAGEDYETKYGEVWVFTDKETVKWYKGNKAGVSDWTLRFKQLIGLPEDGKYTHVTAMWVNPADVHRPAFERDSTKPVSEVKLPDDVDPAFKEWFNGNIIWSYFDSAWPWTRLGYTYDWADNGTEYGLSEFIIKKNATVQVEWTKTTDEFVAWLSIQ
ncbi:hypothetical protein [Treponema primitia]|uniref:hypothetical protein n=1 Tax=Treponema primitia TaxID=88058 RepID=UPI000255551C|nr:hypothetical protein [Treponema primitia]